MELMKQEVNNIIEELGITLDVDVDNYESIIDADYFIYLDCVGPEDKMDGVKCGTIFIKEDKFDKLNQEHKFEDRYSIIDKKSDYFSTRSATPSTRVLCIRLEPKEDYRCKCGS